MNVAHGGTSLDDTLAALTDAEIADLKANYPLRPTATVGSDRYNAWLRQAYVLRHLFDDISVDPFG
jgi:hypothetical protein